MKTAFSVKRFVTDLKKENKISQVLVLFSFVTTYAIVRIITHLQKAHLLPNQSGPLHIHHMVPGILLILITGYIAIAYWNKEKVRHVCAVLFGIGAALTLDEFALWLFLQDVYWAKQGRDSVDAVIIAIVLLTLTVIMGRTHAMKESKGKIKK